MAEAENIDIGDPYLQNLNIRPARKIIRESQLKTKGKDMRRRGFNKLRVVVIESVFSSDIMQGSGILCPSADDWPDFGEEVDDLMTGYDYQWVLTAAHCVSVKKRSRCRMPDRMRIRIPKYKQWPSKKLKSFQAGPREALESNRFEDVLYEADEIGKYVHVYDPYKVYFSSQDGEDFALIQIPKYKSGLPPNTFQVWDTSKRPDGFSIVGFPAEAEKSYLPYFDRRKEEFNEFEESARDKEHVQMYYTSETSGGQSGGPIQFLNADENYPAVVGVHVTGKNTGDGEASGCMITQKICEWVRDVQKNAIEIQRSQDSLPSTTSEKRKSSKQADLPVFTYPPLCADDVRVDTNSRFYENKWKDGALALVHNGTDVGLSSWKESYWWADNSEGWIKVRLPHNWQQLEVFWNDHTFRAPRQLKAYVHGSDSFEDPFKTMVNEIQGLPRNGTWGVVLEAKDCPSDSKMAMLTLVGKKGNHIRVTALRFLVKT